MVGVKQKAVRRDRIRERHSLQRANVEGAIETELLERLQEGMYGELYDIKGKEEEKVGDSQDEKQAEPEEEGIQFIDGDEEFEFENEYEMPEL